MKWKEIEDSGRRIIRKCEGRTLGTAMTGTEEELGCNKDMTMKVVVHMESWMTIANRKYDTLKRLLM